MLGSEETPKRVTKAPTSGSPYRCVFVTLGSFSHINNALIEGFRQELPQVAIKRFDVLEEMKRSVVSLFRIGLDLLREYGLSGFRSRARLRYCFYRSEAFYRETRRLIARRLGQEQHDFTLQTQSLFNAAAGDAPNFVYTDHAALARRRASWDSGEGEPSQKWLQLEREIYADAAHSFVFGSSIRDLLIEEYGISPDRASAIGAGASVMPAQDVDTSVERYSARRILFVGIDWERKGGPELVEAFAKVRTALPDATLTIIGSSPAVQVEGCTVLGRLPREELVGHYHAASCFCMPSKLEPYGVVFAEALHFGLPVIAADVGDVSDIVADGEAGFLVPPGDSGAIAEGLIKLLRDPEVCQQMGKRAVERAAYFTWRSVARRIGEHLPICRGAVGEQR